MISLAKILEKLFLKWCRKDEFSSKSLRSFFLSKYGVEIGLYSYGCFDEKRFPRGTKIGRYCSFANGVMVFNGNHGLNFLSLHPYLYNVRLGCVDRETIDRYRCEFEDDCWVGYSATILPSVRKIGRGSVIGAGAVVTKDVPRYAIVVGNPARIVRYRFSQEVIDKIEASCWWNSSVDELKSLIREKPELVFSPARYFSDLPDGGVVDEG